MKKIGLCIAYKNSNYGTLMQAYATQHVIENLGCETEIIDYRSGIDRGYTISIESIIYLMISKSKKLLTNLCAKDSVSSAQIRNSAQRSEIGNQFCNRMLHNIVRVNGKKALKNKAKEYDAVLVGSDQVWDPTAAFTYYYSLMFAPKGVKRISYSTSLGVDHYPWYVYRQAKVFLEKIDSLSVRERQGAGVIKDVCGRNALVVLDPVYLLDKDEWEAIINNEKIIDEAYVLSYFLGDNPGMKKIAFDFAKERNLKVVSILSDEVNSNDDDVSDIVLTNQSPENFINLIRNAEYVFTDSFHGFAFSVLNEKQVYITYRTRAGITSRNSRIDNILSLLGLEKRLIFSDVDNSSLTIDINYKEVNELLSHLREKSLCFLTDALNV